MSERKLSMRALAMKVLVVAVANPHIGDWAAYIDAVKGDSHQKEKDKVARDGSKLPYSVAKVLFPAFNAQYKWRN